MHQETLDLALRVSDWHSDRYNYLAAMHEAIKEGFAMSIDDAAPANLTEDQAKFLKLGITACLQTFFELPFSLARVDDDEDEAPADLDKVD